MHRPVTIPATELVAPLLSSSEFDEVVTLRQRQTLERPGVRNAQLHQLHEGLLPPSGSGSGDREV
jgi:hypothetical protein